MKYTYKMAGYITKFKCGYIADPSECQCHFCIDVETTFAQLSGMVCLQVNIDSFVHSDSFMIMHRNMLKPDIRKTNITLIIIQQQAQMTSCEGK